jgi:LacI family transcriptional regulator
MARTNNVTLADVARKAGVSITTVSFILRQARGGFAKSTVEKVQAAAKELGFRPNMIAQSLRTGRTRLIGVVTAADAESTHHVTKVHLDIGIALEARKHRVDIVQVLTPVFPDSEVDRITELLDSGLVEGAILGAPLRGSSVLPELLSHNATFVVIGNPSNPNIYSVDNDNVAVGSAAAQHLIDLGHKRLAYLAPPEGYPFGNDRVEGFIRACAGAGLERAASPVLRASDSMAGGYSGMRKILDIAPDTTGVCTGDDQMANGAIQAISEAGLSVPDDISIVGCNNDVIFATDRDLLTSIDLDFLNLGSMAARKLIALIEGEPVSKRDFGQFTLIHRKSSAPPKG